ncbi:MAG: CheR family methyltransferase [Shimia sp.]
MRSPPCEARGIGKDEALAIIVEEVRKRTGIDIAPGRHAFLVARLAKQIRLHAQGVIENYAARLSAGDPALDDGFIDSMVTSYSFHFRQRAQFDQLEREVLPTLLASARGGQVGTIWSAGCAAGQEPVSLAVALFDLDATWTRWPLKLIATDISPRNLVDAKAGAAKRPHEGRLAAHTTPEGRMQPRVLHSIEWRLGNIHDRSQYPPDCRLILCRNVAIYFDAQTRQALWRSLAENLAPGGWLGIGHSERITEPQALGLRAIGNTLYRKD